MKKEKPIVTPEFIINWSNQGPAYGILVDMQRIPTGNFTKIRVRMRESVFKKKTGMKGKKLNRMRASEIHTFTVYDDQIVKLNDLPNCEVPTIMIMPFNISETSTELLNSPFGAVNRKYIAESQGKSARIDGLVTKQRDVLKIMNTIALGELTEANFIAVDKAKKLLRPEGEYIQPMKTPAKTEHKKT